MYFKLHAFHSYAFIVCCVVTKLQGIFQSFNEERKDIESALEASLKAVQTLDVSIMHTSNVLPTFWTFTS